MKSITLGKLLATSLIAATAAIDVSPARLLM